MRCKNCGSELRDGAKFCGKCGTIVTEEANRPVEPTMPITPNYRPSQSQEDIKRTKQKNIIIVLLSCLVVFVLVDVIVLFGFMSKRAKKEDTTTISASSEQITEAKEEESSETTEAVRPDPVFTRANCSSIRNTDSEAGQYSVGAVIDGDIQTKWAPRNANRGLGEWIEIIADEPQYVTGMQIANGYPRDQLTWQRNNRVKDCTISFGDGTYLNVTLLDQKDLQTVNFGREVETNSIRITINSIYYGTKWKDVAIAEIIPFNDNNK